MAKELCCSTTSENVDVHQTPEANTTFIVTGFGPFQDVNSNPTTKIIEHLRNNPSSMQSLLPGIKVAKFLILETSAGAVKHDLNNLFEDIKNDTTFHKLVILHLGVATMYKNFRLEQNAYNEATFRIPDQRGYAPQKEVVCDDLKLCECLETKLDLNMLKKKMTQGGDAISDDVIISNDPGRFVCNYTYCYSLANFSSSVLKRHVLFLHVPPLEVIDQEKQICFILSLMNRIHETISS